MDDYFCIRYPHVFKPMQAVNAVILLICLGAATPVDGGGVLWFVSLTSLIISTLATVIFMMDKNEPVVITLTGGLLSWNIIEFIYSSVLTILCGISFWLAFGYASHVPSDGHPSGYVLFGLFAVVQTVFYLIPTILAYDSIRVLEGTANDSHNGQSFTPDQEQDDRYQLAKETGQVV